jgi:acyl-CoA thioester hydrolase
LKVTPHSRCDYRWFTPMPTRWADNDVYGHVNNTAYYGFFDSAVNRFLIDEKALDIETGDQIGLVVQTSCHYFAPLAFPDILDVGVRAERVGNSSIVYGLGVFGPDQDTASAQGRFVHVYVDRQNRKPKPLNANLRQAVMTIRGEEQS